MLLLALDTSSSTVSVALRDGDAVIAHRDVVGERRHGEVLAPTIASVLADAGVAPRDLTHLAVGVGPGPFTGLRVGLATAQTMAFALGIPVHGVCSLDAIAHGANPGGDVVVATDARRREVYWSTYRDGQRLSDPAVNAAADIDEQTRALPAFGAGALLYADTFANPQSFEISARDLADVAVRQLAEADPVAPMPMYLRRPDAVVPGARKRVTQGGPQ